MPSFFPMIGIHTFKQPAVRYDSWWSGRPNIDQMEGWGVQCPGQGETLAFPVGLLILSHCDILIMFKILIEYWIA